MRSLLARTAYKLGIPYRQSPWETESRIEGWGLVWQSWVVQSLGQCRDILRGQKSAEAGWLIPGARPSQVTPWDPELDPKPWGAEVSQHGTPARLLSEDHLQETTQTGLNPCPFPDRGILPGWAWVQVPFRPQRGQLCVTHHAAQSLRCQAGAGQGLWASTLQLCRLGTRARGSAGRPGLWALLWLALGTLHRDPAPCPCSWGGSCRPDPLPLRGTLSPGLPLVPYARALCNTGTDPSCRPRGPDPVSPWWAPRTCWIGPLRGLWQGSSPFLDIMQQTAAIPSSVALSGIVRVRDMRIRGSLAQLGFHCHAVLTGMTGDPGGPRAGELSRNSRGHWFGAVGGWTGMGGPTGHEGGETQGCTWEKVSGPCTA